MKEIHFEYKQEILEGAVGIETIITNLVTVLEELRKSINSQNSLNIMKEELIALQEASNKVSDKSDHKSVDQDYAVELSLELHIILEKVQKLTQEMMLMSKDLTSTGEKAEELSNLLVNCKKIGSSLNSHILIQDRTKTPPSSPEFKGKAMQEAVAAQDPILSFVSHIVTSTAEVLDNDSPHDDIIDLVETSQFKENIQSTTPQEDYPALEKIGGSEEENKGIFRSIKQKVSSAFSKSEDVELVEEPEIQPPSEESKENNDPPPSGFLSSIKQRVGGFFYSQPKSEDEQEVEEQIESK